MWIFLNDAMLSIVEDRNDPDMLLVRARVKGDILRAFAGDRGPRIRERKTPKADYLFRARISRARVARAMHRRIVGIDYDNFKNSVQADDRHDAYLRVWGAMHTFQTQREPRWDTPTPFELGVTGRIDE